MAATSPYLNTALRSESEIALGRVLAAVDDAQTALGWYSFAQAVNRIFEAKDRYDEARLRAGDQHQ